MVFATNETWSDCYLIVFYLDDSTTAAAYWHFLGFSLGLVSCLVGVGFGFKGWFRIYLVLI